MSSGTPPATFRMKSTTHCSCALCSHSRMQYSTKSLLAVDFRAFRKMRREESTLTGWHDGHTPRNDRAKVCNGATKNTNDGPKTGQDPLLPGLQREPTGR